MDWDEELLLKQIDEYFDTKTKEEIIEDLIKTGAYEYIILASENE